MNLEEINDKLDEINHLKRECEVVDGKSYWEEGVDVKWNAIIDNEDMEDIYTRAKKCALMTQNINMVQKELKSDLVEATPSDMTVEKFCTEQIFSEKPILKKKWLQRCDLLLNLKQKKDKELCPIALNESILLHHEANYRLSEENIVKPDGTTGLIARKIENDCVNFPLISEYPYYKDGKHILTTVTKTYDKPFGNNRVSKYIVYTPKYPNNELENMGVDDLWNDILTNHNIELLLENKSIDPKLYSILRESDPPLNLLWMNLSEENQMYLIQHKPKLIDIIAKNIRRKQGEIECMHLGYNIKGREKQEEEGISVEDIEVVDYEPIKDPEDMKIEQLWDIFRNYNSEIILKNISVDTNLYTVFIKKRDNSWDTLKSNEQNILKQKKSDLIYIIKNEGIDKTKIFNPAETDRQLAKFYKTMETMKEAKEYTPRQVIHNAHASNLQVLVENNFNIQAMEGNPNNSYNMRSQFTSILRQIDPAILTQHFIPIIKGYYNEYKDEISAGKADFQWIYKWCAMNEKIALLVPLEDWEWVSDFTGISVLNLAPEIVVKKILEKIESIVNTEKRKEWYDKLGVDVKSMVTSNTTINSLSVERELFNKDLDSRNKSLSNVVFVDCSFTDIKINWNRLTECDFLRCNFNNVYFTNNTMRDCKFTKCVFNKTDLSTKNVMKDNYFRECKFVNSLIYEYMIEDKKFPLGNANEFHLCEFKNTIIPFNDYLYNLEAADITEEDDVKAAWEENSDIELFFRWEQDPLKWNEKWHIFTEITRDIMKAVQSKVKKIFKKIKEKKSKNHLFDEVWEIYYSFISNPHITITDLINKGDTFIENTDEMVSLLEISGAKGIYDEWREVYHEAAKKGLLHVEAGIPKKVELYYPRYESMSGAIMITDEYDQMWYSVYAGDIYSWLRYQDERFGNMNLLEVLKFAEEMNEQGYERDYYRSLMEELTDSINKNQDEWTEREVEFVLSKSELFNKSSFLQTYEELYEAYSIYCMEDLGEWTLDEECVLRYFLELDDWSAREWKKWK